MSEFILRGNKVMLDKPQKKEKESNLGIILTEEIEKEQEKELMKQWTHLNVFAVGTEVEDVKVGDKVYVRTQALHNAEIIEMDSGIKMLVLVHDVIMVWK